MMTIGEHAELSAKLARNKRRAEFLDTLGVIASFGFTVALVLGIYFASDILEAFK